LDDVEDILKLWLLRRLLQYRLLFHSLFRLLPPFELLQRFMYHAYKPTFSGLAIQCSEIYILITKLAA